MPDSQTFVLMERKAINPATDVFYITSLFEASFATTTTPLNFVPVFASTNYYNNVYLPATQNFTFGMVT